MWSFAADFICVIRCSSIRLCFFESCNSSDNVHCCLLILSICSLCLARVFSISFRWLTSWRYESSDSLICKEILVVCNVQYDGQRVYFHYFTLNNASSSVNPQNKSYSLKCWMQVHFSFAYFVRFIISLILQQLSFNTQILKFLVHFFIYTGLVFLWDTISKSLSLFWHLNS